MLIPNIERQNTSQRYRCYNMAKDKDGRTTWQWSELCYRIAPAISAPERVYVFDNGNKVFYKARKRVNVKHARNRKES